MNPLKTIYTNLLASGKVTISDIKDIEEISEGLITSEHPIGMFTSYPSNILYDEVLTLLKAEVELQEQDALTSTLPDLKKKITEAKSFLEKLTSVSENYPVRLELREDAVVNSILVIVVDDEGVKKPVDLATSTDIYYVLENLNNLEHLDKYEKIVPLANEMNALLEINKDLDLEIITTYGSNMKQFYTLLSGVRRGYALTTLSNTISMSEEVYKNGLLGQLKSTDEIGKSLSNLNHITDKKILVLYTILLLIMQDI